MGGNKKVSLFHITCRRFVLHRCRRRRFSNFRQSLKGENEREREGVSCTALLI